MSGFTKEIIARTFTELLDEKPMSKITVKDIVEHCGVNRNTFYYHFRDIPDVVEVYPEGRNGMRFSKHPQEYRTSSQRNVWKSHGCADQREQEESC